jgi:molybdate transport repressor ModE-like protein
MAAAPHPWPGVEPRRLATLAAVAEAGSFRLAAARLGYAQSTVSGHVAALERAAGVRLVERHSGLRPARLTRAGRRLAARGEELVRRLGAARADLAALAGDRVRIVAEEGLDVRALAPLLAEVRREHPAAALELAVGPRAACLAAVRDGGADAAVVAGGVRGVLIERNGHRRRAPATDLRAAA